MVEEQPLTIKWLIGDWEKNPLHIQGVQMLEISIRFSLILFPKAKRVIAISQLYNKEAKERVVELANKYQCRLLFATDHKNELPEVLRNRERRNAWWKYTPLKVYDGNNLILDNDFIMWSLPPELQDWQTEGGLLGYGALSGNPDPEFVEGKQVFGKGITFGSKHKWVKEHAGTMALNGGLNGIGHDVTNLPVPLKSIKRWDRFPEDQAWWTVNFAKYKGHKAIIDWKLQLPVFYQWSPYVQNKISPQSYMDVFCGGHFTTHNAGYCTYYQDHCHVVFDDYLKQKGF